jgi:hypothetical protein
MKEYLFCGCCNMIVNKDSCEDVVIRGSVEYAGGPPIEPDEHYTKCPECDKAHDDWSDADHDFVLNLISEISNLEQLIQIYEDYKDE